MTDPNSPEIRGWHAVLQRGCPKCHQSSDPADGVLSGQTTPRPDTQTFGKNLTPEPETGLADWDAGTLAGAIRLGIDDQGQGLCSIMPRFAMGDDELQNIVTYLRALTPVWRHIPDSTCISRVAAPSADGGM